MSSFEKQIRAYLRSRPDDSVPSERDLAARLNATRGQVREALLALEGSGLLVRRPQRGYSYVDYSATDLNIARFLRYLIEHEAASIVQGHIPRATQKRLEGLLAELDAAGAARDYCRFAERDAAFHAALVELSRDQLLIRLFSFVGMVTFSLDRAAQERFARHEEYYATTQEIHRAILDALVDGTPEQIHVLLNSHLGADCVKNQELGERFRRYLLGEPGPASRRGRPALWTAEQLETARRNSAATDFNTPQAAGLVVQLIALHGLTGEEVADLFGVSPSAVDRIVHNFRLRQGDVPPATRGRGHALLADEEARDLLAPLGARPEGAPLADLKAALEARLGRPVRVNFLYKLLARLGWTRTGGRGANWRQPPSAP